MDGLDFYFNAEREGIVDGGGAGVKFRTSFYAKNVNVLMALMTDNLGRHGRNVVDRGHILLQREVETDYLRLAFFKREAHSEHVDPLLVLPIGFIMKSEMQAVASPTHEKKVKGRIRFYTRCSIDTQVCMDPMVLTVYMQLEDMNDLNATLGSMTAKFANQDLFFAM